MDDIVAKAKKGTDAEITAEFSGGEEAEDDCSIEDSLACLQLCCKNLEDFQTIPQEKEVHYVHL